MNPFQIDKAIRSLRPGIGYSMDGCDMLSIKMSDGSIVPTPAEILTEYTRISYQDARVAAYPTITDQLDAIMKGGQALADMQAQCMAVKAKFPKPS